MAPVLKLRDAENLQHSLLQLSLLPGTQVLQTRNHSTCAVSSSLGIAIMLLQSSSKENLVIQTVTAGPYTLHHFSTIMEAILMNLCL